MKLQITFAKESAARTFMEQSAYCRVGNCPDAYVSRVECQGVRVGKQYNYVVTITLTYFDIDRENAKIAKSFWSPRRRRTTWKLRTPYDFHSILSSMPTEIVL